MRDLSYTPDLMARSLRGGTDATIGLVVESIADPFFSELVAAVESATSDDGKSVLVASPTATRTSRRRIVGQMLRASRLRTAHRPDRVATTPGCTGRPRLWCWSTARRTGSTPTSSASTTGRPRSTPSSHLIAHGHRDIAYVGDYSQVATSAARLAGYREAMAQHGLSVHERPCPGRAARPRRRPASQWAPACRRTPADGRAQRRDPMLAGRRSRPARAATDRRGARRVR